MIMERMTERMLNRKRRAKAIRDLPSLAEVINPKIPVSTKTMPSIIPSP